jgi:phytoene desaturase
LINHYDYVSKFFKDPRLKISFIFQNMYMGLNPYRSPAIFSLLQYSELADGIWFPVGGMYRIIEVLTAIAEKWGVRFVYDTPVEKINIENQRTTGVKLNDDRQIEADIVVANADLTYVYRDLLPDDGTAKRLARKKFGCSTVMFYWGLDKHITQFMPHNLFMASDFRRSFDPIFEKLTMPEEPNFYIHAPARMDSSLAPAGGDTLTVAIPVGHIEENKPQDWEAIKQRARQFVLQRIAEIGVYDFESHIKIEGSFTPPDWQRRYNLVKGSTHGLSHDLIQMGYLRPRNRHQRYRNLYFVGANTHPGTGLPTVLVSARHVSQRILDEVGVPKSVS